MNQANPLSEEDRAFLHESARKDLELLAYLEAVRLRLSADLRVVRKAIDTLQLRERGVQALRATGQDMIPIDPHDAENHARYGPRGDLRIREVVRLHPVNEPYVERSLREIYTEQGARNPKAMARHAAFELFSRRPVVSQYETMERRVSKRKPNLGDALVPPRLKRSRGSSNGPIELL